jgi:NitT/TauT family transport system substrate-binding protein
VAGKVDVTPTYLTAGAIKLRHKGVALNFIWPGDYGINFYSDALITTNRYLKEKHEIALRFLRASLKGWQYAIEHEIEAVDVTLQYAQMEKDRKIQEEMYEAQIPLIHTGEYPIGWMQANVWQGMHDLLFQYRLIKQPLTDINAVYSLDLINSIYGVQGNDASK